MSTPTDKKLFAVESSFKTITTFTAYIMARSEDDALEIASCIDCIDAVEFNKNIVGYDEHEVECFAVEPDSVDELDDGYQIDESYRIKRAEYNGS